MLGFAIVVLLTLELLASVALDSSAKVIVLALGADPPTIREVEACRCSTCTISSIKCWQLGVQSGRLLPVLKTSCRLGCVFAVVVSVGVLGGERQHGKVLLGV